MEPENDFKMRIDELTQTISEMKSNLNDIMKAFNRQNRCASANANRNRGKKQRKTKKQKDNCEDNSNKNTLLTIPFSQLYPTQFQQSASNNCEDGEDEDSEVFYKK